LKTETRSEKGDFLFYNKTAKTYDRQRFSNRAGKWGHDLQLAALRSLVADWKDSKVLEIGCGTGRITEALVKWGAFVSATDISSEMLQVAEKRFEDGNSLSSPEFRRMSVFDIDIDISDFDYIIMINVFGRLSNPDKAIKNIASGMSPSSRLIFTFPCLTSILFPFGLLVNARGKSLFHNVTSRWYTPQEIECFCGDANLEVVSRRGNHYIPLPRILFWTLPFFWICQKVLPARFPNRYPSVFVECKLNKSNF
jgi:2-polyprenyl-3-methyl-5-hydroxy-6-metoxy-1,4-benzoquinol methylase